MLREDGKAFKWGIKRGIGGSQGEIQFYESFTYDGVEYFLYDCVYMFRDNAPVPDVGKLVKIWETPNHARKVKILWFFRPTEIPEGWGDDLALSNELFLACGEGTGLSNLNPLEVISGKCNVVCTSKDEINSQAPEVELRNADYIFYRVFDVASCKISDKFPDTIAGIKVQCLLNKKEKQKVDSTSKLNVILKEKTGKSNSSLKLDSDKMVAKPVGNGKVNTGCTKSKKPLGSLGKRVCLEDQDTALMAGCSGTSSPMTVSDNCPLKKRKFLDSVDKSPQLKRNVSLEPSSNYDTRSMQAPNIDFNDVSLKFSDPPSRSTDTRMKSISQNNRPSLGMKIDERDTKVSNQEVAHSSQNMFIKPKRQANGVAERPEANKFIKKESRVIEVTKRPKSIAIPGEWKRYLETIVLPRSLGCFPIVQDLNKWFKPLPWVERMHKSRAENTLVLLGNLDPSYASSEVEDIIWNVFQEKVDARMVVRTHFSSTYYGQALVIFKTKDIADYVISQLSRRCLLVDGRPITAYRNPMEPSKQGTDVGHLAINKDRPPRRREEVRKAVSTSHCSQQNTIEYEMAMEWRVIQEKSDIWWKALHEEQVKQTEYGRRELKTVRKALQ